MSAISIMVEEHKNIKRVLKVIRKYCIKILNNEEVDYNNFYKIIDFVRNYADKHHHNKEEEILFKKMEEELGGLVGKGPIQGMLSEHDLGRLYMGNLEKAVKSVLDGDGDSRVDVIGNSMAYHDLLNRHIDKEDSVLYKFAENRLSEESLKDVDEKCKVVEIEAKGRNIQDKYINLIEELEKSINI